MNSSTEDKYTRRLAAREIPRGSHSCVFYASEDERAHIAGAFVQHGIRAGERVLYFADERSPASVVDSFRSIVEDIDGHLSAGDLVVSTAGASYLSTGRFDPVETKAQWLRERDRTMRLGYSALRVVGNMGWAARGIPGSDALVDYERSLESVFSAGSLTGLCEFDRQLFGSAAIMELGSLHDCEAEPEYLCDEMGLTIIPSFSSYGAIFVGVLTSANMHLLERSLFTIMHGVTSSVFFDLSELQVEDPRALYALIRAARQVPVGETLTFVRPAEAIRQAMERNRWDKIANIRIDG
jgi:hypothetical protein